MLVNFLKKWDSHTQVTIGDPILSKWSYFFISCSGIVCLSTTTTHQKTPNPSCPTNQTKPSIQNNDHSTMTIPLKLKQNLTLKNNVPFYANMLILGWTTHFLTPMCILLFSFWALLTDGSIVKVVLREKGFFIYLFLFSFNVIEQIFQIIEYDKLV